MFMNARCNHVSEKPVLHGALWRRQALTRTHHPTGGEQAQYPRDGPPATCKQASRRQEGADPQQMLL